MNEANERGGLVCFFVIPVFDEISVFFVLKGYICLFGWLVDWSWGVVKEHEMRGYEMAGWKEGEGGLGVEG